MATYAEAYLSNARPLGTLVGTTYKGVFQHKGDDYHIAQFDDTVKTASIAMIASLLSLGIKNTSNKISVWVGAFGWWGAMKAYPFVLNKIVEMKTGVPLSSRYKTPDNQIKPFFSDPDYLPVQILPKETIIKLCRRYSIPLNTELTLDKIQSKLKQIVVQTQTWWMLTTGLATPLLASLFCDVLEAPVKRLYIDAKSHYYTSGLKKHPFSKDKYAVEWVSYYINKIIETKLGRNELVDAKETFTDLIPKVLSNTSKNTQMSLWWNKFPRGLIKTLGLDNPVLLSYMSNTKLTEERKFHALIDTVIRQLKSLKNREALETYIKQQATEVHNVVDPLLHLLGNTSPYIERLDPQKRLYFNQHIRLSRGSALGTMEHFKQLLTTFEQFQHASPSVLRHHIRQILEKPNASYVESLFRRGHLTRVHQMTGMYFDEVLRCLQTGRYLPVHDMLGETPKNMLLDSLSSLSRRQKWLFWYPKVLGGSLLVGSLAYLLFFVGTQNKNTGKPYREDGGIA